MEVFVEFTDIKELVQLFN